MKHHNQSAELINKIINKSSDFDRVEIETKDKIIRVTNHAYDHVRIEDMEKKHGFDHIGKSVELNYRNGFVRFFTNTAELRNWIDTIQ